MKTRNDSYSTDTQERKQGHTPGPWSHMPMQDTIWANNWETKVAIIADLPWVTTPSGGRTSDDATEQANARLIAAAPELLAALDWVEATAVNLHCALQATAGMDLDDSRILVITGEVVRDLLILRDRARAAISKAEGGA